MIAAMLDVTIEDLTLVVLAHELTHGYTHIGRDIDGIQWNDRAFGTSDPMMDPRAHSNRNLRFGDNV